jgi:hypothetical protein
VNASWVEGISAVDYVDDVLILAGDVSDSQDRIEWALEVLMSKFSQVFFVPGNHDLWVRRREYGSSIEKFGAILGLCRSMGVKTEPSTVTEDGGDEIHIVPLFSWYSEPDQNAADSLFLPKTGEDPDLSMWSDRRFIRTDPKVPNLAAYFLELNRERVDAEYGSTVISFSHFLPRQELIFSSGSKVKAVGGDPHPGFNFSRVAGSSGLDSQIRAVNARLHVYGHQHRNRFREIDGVTYISNCLGYPRERELGHITDVKDGPALVWDGAVVEHHGIGLGKR